MFGEVKPSKPKGRDGESAASRQALFKSCLERLDVPLPPDARVAFPHGIGCGLAGGNWDDYHASIREFASKRDVVHAQLPESFRGSQGSGGGKCKAAAGGGRQSKVRCTGGAYLHKGPAGCPTCLHFRGLQLRPAQVLPVHSCGAGKVCTAPAASQLWPWNVDVTLSGGPLRL
jgi:hypothetical protein